MRQKMEINDPKYLGIPNICFSLTEKDDDREIAYSKQRIEFGFDDSETWSLRDTIANFILPRLKRFKEIYSETVVDKDGYGDSVGKMILAFELVVRDSGSFILTDDEYIIYEQGMKAFHDGFLGLWW